MSLIVWHPFNGDYNDYSGHQFHATNQGATEGPGRFRKSVVFHDANPQVVNTVKLHPRALSTIRQDFSVCFFMYFNQTDYSNYIMSCYTDKDNAFNFCFLTDGTLELCQDGTIYKTLIPCYEASDLHKWRHFAITKKGSTVTVYKDGKITGTFGDATVNYRHVTNPAILLGGDQDAHNDRLDVNQSLRGALNDFRIYDHALSQLEVNELLKAEIAHYDFNVSADGARNLAKGATYSHYNNFEPDVTAKVEHTFRYYDGCPIVRLKIRVLNESKLESVRNELFAHGIRMCHTTLKAKTKYVYRILWKPVSHPDTKCGGTASNTPGWIEIPSEYYKDGWNVVGQKRDGTSEVEKNDDVFTSVCAPSLQLNEDLIVDFCCPMYYEGRDDVEFNHGFTYNRVTDSSGHCNHAVLPELSPSWVTVRDKTGPGVGAYRFWNDSCIPIGQKCKVPQQITVSAWAKKSNWNDGRNERIISCTEGGGWGIEKSDTISFTLNAEQKYYPSGRLPSANVTPGWHMFTGTYDGRYVKFYFDGKFYAQTDVGGEKIITYNEENGIFIGAEAQKNTTTPHSGYSFHGDIADVRIFATALSDKDIESLYNVKGSITKQDELIAGQFNERVNIASLANKRIKDRVFDLPVAKYEQANCKVNMTEEGITIYRPKDLIYPDCGNTVWGGVIFTFPEQYFKTGHRYRLNLAIRGQTSTAPECYIAYSAGWQTVGGLSYKDTIKVKPVPAGYNNWGEAEIFTYDLDLTDFNIYQKATKQEGDLVVGEYYYCCNQLKFGFGYESTGGGASLEIKHVEFIDITDDLKTEVNKKGQVFTREFNELEGMKIRYITEWLAGSNANNGSHWVQIEAFDKFGRNWALNQPVSADWTPSDPNRPLSRVTNGNKNSDDWTGVDAEPGVSKYVQVDLGADCPPITKVITYHYYNDARIYNSALSVSPDGSEWINLYDSFYHGQYKESINGKSHALQGNTKVGILKDGGCKAKQFIEGGFK